MNKKNIPSKLPLSFKPILWSYDFEKIDPKKNKKTIIVNAINYGDLDHWRWLVNNYGREEVRGILKEISFTEIRERVAPLVAIIFSIDKFNYAPRGDTAKK